LDKAVVVQLPENKDVNQVFQDGGADWLRERALA